MHGLPADNAGTPDTMANILYMAHISCAEFSVKKAQYCTPSFVCGTATSAYWTCGLT